MNRKIDYFTQLNRSESVRQATRLPKELRADYISVDERKLPQLLLALQHYSKNLKYYNLENRSSGTWLSFFENSDALLLACSIPLDTEQYRDRFLRQINGPLLESVPLVMEQLVWFEVWMKNAKKLKHPDSVAVYSNLRLVAQDKLKVYIEKVLVIANEYDQLSEERKLNVGSIWGITNIQLLWDSPRVTSDIQSLSGKRHALQLCFDALLRMRMYLAREASQVFQTLLQEQCHDPASSMLLAFLQTYKRSQDNINEFPEKLLDYYYNNILGNTPEPGLGDNVFIHCVKTSNNRPTLIADGTRFDAGKTPELDDMVYCAQGSTYITGAKLSAIRTIYLQRHIKVSPESTTCAVTRIKDADLLALALGAEQSPGVNTQENKRVSVFGFDDGFCRGAFGSDSSVGLYVSSPLLYLQEGLRSVEIDFELRDRALDIALSRHAKPEDYYNNDRCAMDCKSDCRKVDGVHRLSGLDQKRQHLARGLYSCITPEMKQECELVSQLKAFVTSMDDIHLEGWRKGSEQAVANILKKLWIYLYWSVSDDSLLGMVHGQLISRKMFDSTYLSDADTAMLIKRVQDISLTSDQKKIQQYEFLHDLEQSSFSLLIRYMADAFEFNLSQEQGWLIKTNYSISHLDTDVSTRIGFRVQFELAQDVAPIVAVNPAIHGSECIGNLPVMMVKINPLTRVFPYSYLQPFLVKDANLIVSVRGLKDVCVHNEYGRVDTSKPFLPFSVIPQYDSRFYLGSFEYARKNVTDLTVRFSWKNLPKNYGGFASYYSAYGNGMSNSDYKVNVTMLANSTLIPEDEAAQQLSPLFSFSNNTQTLYDTTELSYSYNHTNPRISNAVTKAQYESMNTVEHAYLCFRLRCTDKAFGHKPYTQIMSQVLTHNSRRRKQKPLPLEPYTPEIEKVEVDYTAQDSIKFAEQFYGDTETIPTNITKSNASMATASTQAYYLTPLGLELAYRRVAYSGVPLTPTWGYDGNCYLAFQCSAEADTLCVFFQFQKDATHLTDDVTSLHWRYFSASGWKVLPESNIMSDGTKGFMHSGIVNIQLPQDLEVHPGLNPKNQFWLCVSTSIDLRHYASFKMIDFDVIKLAAELNDKKLSKHTSGFSYSWRAIEDIPTIQSYKQVQQAFSNTDVENNKEAQVRIYERLRHKNRAVTPWDYERIVLERFPQVDLVKCLPACSVAKHGPAPGHVLVVVIPRLLTTDNVHKQGHHLNAVVLSKILNTLKTLSPSGINLDVINATYEFVQVRCAVRFKARTHVGEQISQLQEDISAYISPWSDKGRFPSFGWSIQTKDIESFIGDLSYVQAVAKVSLVKCFDDNQYPQYFRLKDTASDDGIPLLSSEDIEHAGVMSVGESHRSGIVNQLVRAETPWSLPLPSRRHCIEIIRDEEEADFTAVPVGINTLEIGNTFVIRSGSVNTNG